jgi:hypothetical protein
VFPAQIDAAGIARFDAGFLPDGNYTFSGFVSDNSGNASLIHCAFFVLTGDADHDGIVGPGDFNILASHFGQTGQTFTTGDFNYDGTVGPGDFNLLASRFGQSIATLAAAAAVESPAQLVRINTSAATATRSSVARELLAAPHPRRPVVRHS